LLASASESQRKAFLKSALVNHNLADSFVDASELLVRAAVGIDPRMRNWALDIFQYPVDGKDAALTTARVAGLTLLGGGPIAEDIIGAILATQALASLNSLGEGLGMVAAQLEVMTAKKPVAVQLVQTILKTDVPDYLVPWVQDWGWWQANWRRRLPPPWSLITLRPS
jgi:hypothetical protein